MAKQKIKFINETLFCLYLVKTNYKACPLKYSNMKIVLF